MLTDDEINVISACTTGSMDLVDGESLHELCTQAREANALRAEVAVLKAALREVCDEVGLIDPDYHLVDKLRRLT